MIRAERRSLRESSEHAALARVVRTRRPLAARSVADYLSDASLVTHIDLTTGRSASYQALQRLQSDERQGLQPSPDDPDCIVGRRTS